MKRRDALRSLTVVGGASLLATKEALAETLAPNPAYAPAVKGTAPVKIKDIKVLLTAPDRIRLGAIKIET